MGYYSGGGQGGGATKVFQIINIILGVCVAVFAGIFGHWGNWHWLFFKIAMIYFGVLTVLAETYWLQPFKEWYGWFEKWVGEGLWFIFLAVLMWITEAANYGYYRGKGCGAGYLSCDDDGAFHLSLPYFTALALTVFGIVYIIMGLVGCCGGNDKQPMCGEAGSKPQGCCSVGDCCPGPVMNIVLIIFGALIILCGVIGCWGGCQGHKDWTSLWHIILQVTIIAMGVITILMEICKPGIIEENMGFFSCYFGEGIFFIFMSTLCWFNHDRDLHGIIAPGLIVLGIILIVFHFCGMQKPSPLGGC